MKVVEPQLTRAGGAECRRGVTLIEAVAAIVVLGLAIPPVVGLFRQVGSAQVLQGQELRAGYLAEAMLEEIRSKAFADPELGESSFGPEESTRAAFDDVDDFHGLEFAPPVRVDGGAIPGVEGMTLWVGVEPLDDVVSGSGSEFDSVPISEVIPTGDASALKHVTVHVAWDGGELSVATLRGHLDSTPPVDGPLDENAAQNSATVWGGKKMRMFPRNTTGQYTPIYSVSMSCSEPGQYLKWIEFAGRKMLDPDDELELPTGDVPLEGAEWRERTFTPWATRMLEFEFDDDPEGSIDYEFDLVFLDGAVSHMEFTLDW